MPKRSLGVDVLTAARQRIARCFDDFDKVCVSFSGGKDSSVLTHLVLDEAKRRNRKVGLLFIDLEAQYRMTVEHVEHMFDTYKDSIDPIWVSLPLHLRNAVSQFDPFWLCWDPDKKDVWVRQPSKWSITDHKHFPFFRVGMEFEEFVPEFAKWYAGGSRLVSLVGIRSDESLNRYRTIASTKKQTHSGLQWTTKNADNVYSAYPIYDWKTEDIWLYNAKFNASYNKVYDYMHQAGVSIHQQRLCQPSGDDQRKGLWLFHLIEPETWTKLLQRMAGINSGALYAQEHGNVMGVGTVIKPDHHTWESYSKLLLETMPPHTAEHYRNKIAKFLKWYETRGYPDRKIPDASPTGKLDKDFPSWQRICKMLLRQDFWAKGLSFGQTKSDAYNKYLDFMKKKREEWGMSI